MPNVMAAQLNIGGALCESSVFHSLHTPQTLADPAAGVPYSNAANIGEHNTWMQSDFCTGQNSVREQEPP